MLNAEFAHEPCLGAGCSQYESASLTGKQPFRSLLIMQTTIQLDDEVLALATKLAEERGCDLSRLIEETLRDRITPRPFIAPQATVQLATVNGGGLRPGVDLNNSAALLTLMDQGA